jgi:hypothetical protein
MSSLGRECVKTLTGQAPAQFHVLQGPAGLGFPGTEAQNCTNSAPRPSSFEFSHRLGQPLPFKVCSERLLFPHGPTNREVGDVPVRHLTSPSVRIYLPLPLIEHRTPRDHPKAPFRRLHQHQSQAALNPYGSQCAHCKRERHCDRAAPALMPLQDYIDSSNASSRRTL